MKEFSIVMAYYENPNMLALHIETWMRYTRINAAWVKFVIVDDGSPEHPAFDVISRYRHGCDIQLFRVLKDVPWGQDGARNIGMKYVDTEWALMTDMDHLLDDDNMHRVLAKTVDRKHYYMPLRQCNGLVKNPHPNSFLMHKHDFWRMGGYDEDFVGYYGSDGNFRKCAKGAGLREIMLANVTLTEFKPDQVSDANTSKYSRKEGPYYAAANEHLEARRRGPAYRATNPFRLPYERLL